MEINFQKNLLLTSRRYNLPVSVQSTCIILYKILKDKMDINCTDNNFIYAFILVSIKIESSHSKYNFLKMGDEEKIMEYERIILKESNFSLNIPSPYLRVFGMVIILQQKGYLEVFDGCLGEKEDVVVVKDVNEFYRKSMLNLDMIILLPNYLKYKVNEIAIAALDLPVGLWDKVVENVNIENIKNIMEEMKEIESSL